MRIAELCAENDVKLVLLPGDLFDSDDAYQETAETLTRALSRIDVPVFIAPGNHDFYGRGSHYARMALPENVRIFKEPRIECIEIPDLSVRVWGAGFDDRYCGSLLRAFTAEKREGTLDRLLADVAKARLLVLDEFGYVPFDVDGARLLYQVISESYERRSVIFTTNVEFSRWGTVFADDKLAAAIVDRVVHHGRLVEFGGPSHRLEDSLMLGKGGAR